MSSLTTQLPMIECSSCGKYVGHLFDQYYNAILVLEDKHQGILNGEGNLDTEDPYDLGGIWTNYIRVYYKFMLGKKESLSEEQYKRLANLYSVRALIQKALLFHRPLTDDDLPLNEHERDTGCVRACCKRALACDNSNSMY